MLNVTADDNTILIDVPDNNIVEDNRTVSALLSSGDPAITVIVKDGQFLIVDNDCKF